MIFEEYLALRDELSAESVRLFGTYTDHLQCRFGCYYCCDNIAVLPLEIEGVRRHVSQHGFPPDEVLGGPEEDHGETPEDRVRSVDRSPDGTFPHTPESEKRPRCAFLGRRGECTVYAARPIICRTHGLPLSYRVYEYDRHGREVRAANPEYMDLWCDLNFRSLPAEGARAFFDSRGRINMDGVNHRLVELNRRFLASAEGARYRSRFAGGPEERAPLEILFST